MSIHQILTTLEKIDTQLDRIDGRLNEHDDKFGAIFELLEVIQKQTNKIPQLETDVRNLQGDISIIKKVIIDRNKQISRHERFINAIKAAG